MPHEHVTVEPLTRRDAAGGVYRRTAAVDAQIATALALGTAATVAWAEGALPDIGGGAEPLHEEAIVYLLRSYQRAGESGAVNALVTVLLARCTKLLKRRLGSLEVQSFEDAYADCVAGLAAAILDLHSDRGDFFQVRFWTAMERLAISTFNRHWEHQDRDRYTVPLDGEDATDENPRHEVPDPRLPDDLLLQIREALAFIAEPGRTAFILRHYYGWPVEDRDLGVPTISRYFDKTGRMIRNYLRQADEDLARWRGEGS